MRAIAGPVNAPVSLAPRDGATGAAAALTLDLTRLFSRLLHRTPTGIDRVELAYARALLALRDRAVAFERWVPGLGFVGCAPRAVARLIDALDARWARGEAAGIGAAVAAWTQLRPRPRYRSRQHGAARVRLIVSHQHLDRRDRLDRRGGDAGDRLCVYLHDAIPVEFPEYARPGGAARHRRRLIHAVTLADAILVNSDSTARAVAAHAAAIGRHPPIRVAPLGIEPQFRAPVAPQEAGAPYFLCIGTIEPRKNHLLLLHVWRALAAQLGDATPRLVLAGRRGWENENILDLLDRCPALHGKVVEAGRIGDAALAPLLAGARAVLMPSFAEGFGLPVAEALAAGVPVIASDIAVLRETGGAVPDYLDPLDGPGWMRAVCDYAAPQSPRRAAQMARMQGWRAPDWDAHFRQVLPFLDAL